MALVKRMPPQNIEAEQAVLGAMLIKREAIVEVQEILQPADFYREIHRMIYEAMITLQNHDEAVDLVTLAEELRRENLLDRAGGIGSITHLANIVGTAANIRYHAKVVKEKAELRNLITVATDIACKAYEDSDDVDWNRLVGVADALCRIPLYIDDQGGLTIMELRSKARRLKAEHGLDLIIIDYLQLMQGRNGRANDNSQQEISDISRSLKALARELDVPIIVLSQLSRSVELRQVKKPMLSDLRESGSLEQDADFVMFLYREDYYDKDTANKNLTEVIVAKHRNGPVDSVNLYFLKEYTKFRDLMEQ